MVVPSRSNCKREHLRSEQYFFQWDAVPDEHPQTISTADAQTLLRFVLHDFDLYTAQGKPIRVGVHVLRHVMSTAGRLATVERLQTAIDTLKTKRQEISVQAIFEGCDSRYAASHRKPEALALFRANSTHLVAEKKRRKRKPHADEESVPTPSDRLLSYKKPQLVARLCSAQRQILEVQQNQAAMVEAKLQQEAQVAELEAKLAILEPYQTFVMQMREQMQWEENGLLSDLPPDT